MAETEYVPRYYVDVDEDANEQRSVKAMIADRRCTVCRQGDTTESVMAAKTKDLVKRIADQCLDAEDFLLPDTPLMEGIFRVILAGGNKPKTAEQVSEDLSKRWAMSAYPRDLSPAVIKRVLDYSGTYSIAVTPPPEPEAEPPTDIAAEKVVEVAEESKEKEEG